MVLVASLAIIVYQNREQIFKKNSASVNQENAATPIPTTTTSPTVVPTVTGNEAIDTANTAVSDIINDATNIPDSTAGTDSVVDSQILDDYNQTVTNNQSL